MTELFTGITAEWDGDGDLPGAVAGGLWLVKADAGTGLPYVTFDLEDASPEYDTEYTKAMENAIIMFKIHSDESAATEINTIYGHLIDCYDFCTLDVGAGYDHIEMRRQGQSLDKDENDRWIYYVTYKIIIQKT